MRVLYTDSTVNREIREKRENRKARIRKELDAYGSDVLESDEMQRAFEQTHHQKSTVAEHTIRVAMSSVMICYALRKLHISTNIPAVVVGSLCHDLGIIGRDEKYSSERECHREHPKDSVAVAKELIEDLPEGTEQIIERHMWPIGDSKAPRTLESAVVSVADKYTAVKDIVKGREPDHPVVKKYDKPAARCSLRDSRSQTR